MRTLSFPLEIKALDEDGTLEGYGSVFGVKDLGGDIVEPGAFRATLKRRGAKGVRMLADHDPTKRIGVWDDMAEDETGLRVRGRLLLEKQIARDAYVDLKAGAVEGLSIGYQIPAKGAAYDGRSRARRIKELDLLEISLVTFPMNTAATVTAVKSADDMTIREFEEGLASGTLPPLGAKAAKRLLAGGFQSLNAERDASEGDDVLAALTRRLQAMGA